MRGARLRIRVQPRASRSEVVRYADATLWLRVAAPPQGGQANEAVVELLAKSLGVTKSRINIVRGHASRDKVVEIEGLAEGELERWLAKL